MTIIVDGKWQLPLYFFLFEWFFHWNWRTLPKSIFIECINPCHSVVMMEKSYFTKIQFGSKPKSAILLELIKKKMK